MLEETVVIPNQLGLHARSSSKLVSISSRFLSDINIIYQGKVVNGKSIMELLMLAAKQGESLTIQCQGEDESLALSELVRLVNKGFGELD